MATFDNRTDTAITWRKNMTCGNKNCTIPLEDLGGKKNSFTVWKRGIEYHKECYNSSCPVYTCDKCGLEFVDQKTKYREHILSAHNESGKVPEVKMYIPDGMINDRNMEQVLKENKLLKPHRVRCLQTAIEWFQKIGVSYFISDGTLLGAYRENGKMIDTDIDVDVSILEPDLKKLWENRHLLPDGYLVDTSSTGVDWSDKLDEPFQMVGAKKFTLVDVQNYNDIVVETMAPECDIYSYRVDAENPDYYRNNYAKPNQAVHLRKWRKEWIFPLKEMEFEGLKVTAPNDPEKYLLELYGYIGRDAFWNPETKYYEKLPSTESS